MVQEATWLAGTACTGAHTGLSHGIGYLLGANFGVPHGMCSCITLPNVMAWNGAKGIKADRVVRNAAGRSETGSEIVDGLIRALGLPRRIRDVIDVSEAEVMALAPKVMALPHAPRNPRVPASQDEARALLFSMY